MSDEDDFGSFRSKAELTTAEHLRYFVEDGGLQRLLYFCDRICLLRLAGAEIVDGQDWIALRCGVLHPIVLGRAIWVTWKTEPVALRRSQPDIS